MPAIPLAEAMIVWTPRNELWLTEGNWAPAGSIAVVQWPDDRNAWTRYPSSAGACDRDWQEGDDNYRLQQLANLVGQWLDEQNMNPEHVAEALRAIDGVERLRDFKSEPRH